MINDNYSLNPTQIAEIIEVLNGFISKNEFSKNEKETIKKTNNDTRGGND